MAGKAKKSFALRRSEDHPGRDVIIWIDASGETKTALLGPKLRDLGIEHARRARWPAQYKNRAAREGLFWLSQTGEHVWHESGLELAGLMMLDYYLDLAAVTAQPCLIQWADGTKHFPDFLITLSDGSQMLFDVHAQRFITDKAQATFDATSAACKRIGWDYRIFTGIDPVVLRNLRLIAGYRHPLNAPSPPLAELFTSLPEAPLHQIRALAPTLPDVLAHAHIYHLIWVKRLDFNVHSPLTTSTIIRNAA